MSKMISTSTKEEVHNKVRGKIIPALAVLGFVLLFANSNDGRMSIYPESSITNTLPQSIRQDFLPVAFSFFDPANGTMNNENITVTTIKSTALHLVGDRFLACHAPKTGVTAWRNFYLYVNTDRLLTIEETRNDPGVVHRQPKNMLGGLKLSREKVLEKFNNLDQIIVGRNPYVRFLSSYFDWLSRVG